MTKLRLSIAPWLGVLAALTLQAPAGALSSASGWAAAPGVQTAPPPKGSAPSVQSGSPARGPARGQPPSRPPNAPREPPRPGQGSGDSSLIEARWPWWRDSDVKRELGLGDETAKVINAIVHEREEKFRPIWENYVAEFSTLNKMTSEATVDQAAYEHQARMVYYLRSLLDSSRTVMNFRIYKLLRPEQLKKLQQIVERRNARADRDRSPGSGR